MKEAKRNFEKMLAKNIRSDRKSFFAYVRSKCKSNVRSGPLINEAGNIITDLKESANLFNEYFSSVFTTEDLSSVPSHTGESPPTTHLTDLNITEEMVKSKLKKLRPDKAGGADNMLPRLLVSIQHEISYPLWLLFRKSIKEADVPADWKTANVTPIFKKGNKGLPENYRPVSLTSQCSKLLEAIVRDGLTEFLEANSIITATQHGFRTGRSCLSNLLSFFDEVSKSIDSGTAVDAIYLDFAKAFDKVPHGRLLHKLEKYGIRGQLLNWIKAWLSGRSQRVCLEGTVSDWVAVISGVPQGSVLGPLLFLVYINDLEDGIKSSILKFADDTKMFRKISNTGDTRQLQEDLDVLIQWSKKWQMLFNVEKCKVMHIGNPKDPKANYFMQGCQLDECLEEKDLGVLISSDLKVGSQCKQAFLKANRMLGVLKRTVINKTPGIMINFYKSLVRPHVEYCVSAWSPHYAKDKHLLERIQHRFTKLIPGIRHLPYADRLSKLNLWTLEERRNRADLLEVFKMAKNISSIPLSSFFELNTDSRTRGHSLKLVKHRCHLEMRRHFFSERVINRWNKLDQDTVSASTINAFKSRLEKERIRKMGLFMD